MADLATAYAGYQVFLQKRSGKRLHNRLFNIMPVLYLLTGLTGKKPKDVGLGAPNTATSVLISGTRTASPNKEKMFAESAYRPTIQYQAPASTDGKTIGQYDTMPTRTSPSTLTPASYFIQPEFHFHEHADPYEVPNDQIETIVANTTGGWPAQATLAIGNIMDAEVESVQGTHLKYFNQVLWGTTGSGAPSDQTAVKWDTLHSLKNSIGAHGTAAGGNNYGGLDRTLHSFWEGKGTDSTGNIVFRDLIRTLNYDPNYRFADVGAGVDIIACDGNLFQKALNEADGKSGIILHNGLPKEGEIGFKQDLVCFDNKTYVVYDPECPSGEMAALNSSTWTVAIHPNKNFKISTPEDQQKIRGGVDSTTGTIRTKMLWCCEEPHYNAYFTGCT